jgi:hypothetical protein
MECYKIKTSAGSVGFMINNSMTDNHIRCHCTKGNGERVHIDAGQDECIKEMISTHRKGGRLADSFLYMECNIDTFNNIQTAFYCLTDESNG